MLFQRIGEDHSRRGEGVRRCIPHRHTAILPIKIHRQSVTDIIMWCKPNREVRAGNGQRKERGKRRDHPLPPIPVSATVRGSGQIYSAYSTDMNMYTCRCPAWQPADYDAIMSLRSDND